MPAPTLRLSLSRSAASGGPTREAADVLDADRASAARETVRSRDGYRPTPLIDLPGLARRLGVAAVRCKDESARFGIGSFKALGGGYATLCAVREEIGRRTGVRPSVAELEAGHPAAATITTTTASAGNHGRSVAWGSERLGCRSVVFLPRGTARARAVAIESHGAEVVWFEGEYDAAVHHAEREAGRNGWLVVSDTSYEGYEHIPRRVMEGYTLLADELLESLGESETLTHLFIQAGVGGLATGVCGHLWHRLGARRPAFIAVEPWRADCFGRSLRVGRATSVPGPFGTAMGGLASGVPSRLAWRLLSGCLDAAVAIPESAWRAGAAALQSGELGTPIVAGPSGAAGVGALLTLTRLPTARRLLGLTTYSRIGVVVTETRF